jgi:hypothetical protein
MVPSETFGAEDFQNSRVTHALTAAQEHDESDPSVALERREFASATRHRDTGCREEPHAEHHDRERKHHKRGWHAESKPAEEIHLDAVLRKPLDGDRVRRTSNRRERAADTRGERDTEEERNRPTCRRPPVGCLPCAEFAASRACVPSAIASGNIVGCRREVRDKRAQERRREHDRREHRDRPRACDRDESFRESARDAAAIKRQREQRTAAEEKHDVVRVGRSNLGGFANSKRGERDERQ